MVTVSDADPWASIITTGKLARLLRWNDQGGNNLTLEVSSYHPILVTYTSKTLRAPYEVHRFPFLSARDESTGLENIRLSRPMKFAYPCPRFESAAQCVETQIRRTACLILVTCCL